jgi:hypothetical protein
MQRSLIENGIGCRVVSDGESEQLMIYPSDEPRARQIILEIVAGAQSA